MPTALDPQALLKNQRAFFTTAQSAFHGLNLEELPEPIRGTITKIKTEIDAALSALPPTDQVPAALDASSGLHWLVDSLRRVNEMAAETLASLDKMSRELTAKASALHGLETRVSSGELVEKAKVAEAVAAHSATMKSRRAELALAGLPVPVEDEVLAGGDEQWKARVATAKDRQAKLAERRAATTPTQLQSLLYGDTTLFEVVLANLPPKADPVAGGGAAGASGDKPPRMRGI